MSGWIGVDLDGTLAEYTSWSGPGNIGAPIKAMVERVQRWLVLGKEVRIFTARLSGSYADIVLARIAIEAWSKEHLGVILPVTNEKDYGMIELWDDRAVQVEMNTGKRIGYSTRGLD